MLAKDVFLSPTRELWSLFYTRKHNREYKNLKLFKYAFSVAKQSVQIWIVILRTKTTYKHKIIFRRDVWSATKTSFLCFYLWSKLPDVRMPPASFVWYSVWRPADSAGLSHLDCFNSAGITSFSHWQRSSPVTPIELPKHNQH